MSLFVELGAAELVNYTAIKSQSSFWNKEYVVENERDRVSSTVIEIYLDKL